VQDLLRHMLAFREVIEAERAWPRIDEVDHLLDVVHLTSRWLGARPDPGYPGQKPVSLEAPPMPRTKKRSLPSCRRKIPPGRTFAGNKRSSSTSIPTDPVSVIGKTNSPDEERRLTEDGPAKAFRPIFLDSRRTARFDPPSYKTQLGKPASVNLQGPFPATELEPDITP